MSAAYPMFIFEAGNGFAAQAAAQPAAPQVTAPVRVYPDPSSISDTQILHANGNTVFAGQHFTIADADAPITIKIYLHNTNSPIIFLNTPITITLPSRYLILNNLFLQVRSDIHHRHNMAAHYGTVDAAVTASIPATLNELLSHDTIDLRWARDAYWTGAAHITSASQQYHGIEGLVRVHLFEVGLLAAIAGTVGCNQVQQCNLMALAASLTIDEALYDDMWRELATLRIDAINNGRVPVFPQALINTAIRTVAMREQTLDCLEAGCQRAGTLLAEAMSPGDIAEAVARINAVHRGVQDLRAAINGGEESSDSSDSSDPSGSSSSDEEEDEGEEEDEDEDMPDAPAVNVAPAPAAPAIPAAAAAPPPPGAAAAQYRHTPGSPGDLDWVCLLCNNHGGIKHKSSLTRHFLLTHQLAVNVQ